MKEVGLFQVRLLIHLRAFLSYKTGSGSQVFPTITHHLRAFSCQCQGLTIGPSACNLCALAQSCGQTLALVYKELRVAYIGFSHTVVSS